MVPRLPARPCTRRRGRCCRNGTRNDSLSTTGREAAILVSEQSTTSFNQCFFCGSANPIGIKLRFSRTENGVSTQLTVGEQYQGYGQVLHGGIVAGLLDEAMWWAIHRTLGSFCFTADMNLRYKRPVPATEPVTVRGAVVEDRRRVVLAEGQILNSAGQVLAEASARFVPRRDMAAQGEAEPGRSG